MNTSETLIYQNQDGNIKVDVRAGGINTGINLEIDNRASSWVKGSISSGNITIEN